MPYTPPHFDLDRRAEYLYKQAAMTHSTVGTVQDTEVLTCQS